MKLLAAALSLYSSLALAAVPTVVSISGKVRLEGGGSPAGVSVTLMFDLNGDGAFSSFEQATTTVDAAGAFSNDFKPDLSKVDFAEGLVLGALLEKVASEGFAALIEDAPRVLVVKFAKEGYAPVYRRLSVLSLATTLEVELRPLTPMACSDSTCLTPGGGVELSGLTRAHGIEGAAARAFSPIRDASAFPGAYASSDGAMLVTSGFFDMQLTGSGGAPITTLPTPVTIRQQVTREALGTLIDASPGTSGVEISMFSFDASKGVWQAEANGRLEDESGTAITEAQLASVRKGEYGKEVLVSFQAPHMSFWNIDRALNDLACVRGRLVTPDGQPMVGAQVEVAGVSYISQGIGLTVGDDGLFAGNVVRSELGGEDVNGDGVTGENFQVRVVASWNGQMLLGEPFATPTIKSTTANKSEALQCLPAACDCVDLGDVTLSALEPRTCEITVTATASADLMRHAKEPSNRQQAGTPVSALVVNSSAKIGAVGLNSTAFNVLCKDPATCRQGVTNTEGVAVIQVPVAGADPVVDLFISQFAIDANGDIMFVSGSAQVTGCIEGQASVAASVEVKQGIYDSFANFASNLQDTPKPVNISDDREVDKDDDKGCGCTGSARAPLGLDLAGALLILPLGVVARRRRR